LLVQVIFQRLQRLQAIHHRPDIRQHHHQFFVGLLQAAKAGIEFKKGEDIGEKRRACNFVTDPS
jgi:hypothetical protein